MTKLQRECLEFYKKPYHKRPVEGENWSLRHQAWANRQGFITPAKHGRWHKITVAGRAALAGA